MDAQDGKKRRKGQALDSLSNTVSHTKRKSLKFHKRCAADSELDSTDTDVEEMDDDWRQSKKQRVVTGHAAVPLRRTGYSNLFLLSKDSRVRQKHMLRSTPTLPGDVKAKWHLTRDVLTWNKVRGSIQMLTSWTTIGITRGSFCAGHVTL